MLHPLIMKIPTAQGARFDFVFVPPVNLVAFVNSIQWEYEEQISCVPIYQYTKMMTKRKQRMHIVVNRLEEPDAAGHDDPQHLHLPCPISTRDPCPIIVSPIARLDGSDHPRYEQGNCDNPLHSNRTNANDDSIPFVLPKHKAHHSCNLLPLR